jgi:hypothetical protein
MSLPLKPKTVGSVVGSVVKMSERDEPRSVGVFSMKSKSGSGGSISGTVTTIRVIGVLVISGFRFIGVAVGSGVGDGDGVGEGLGDGVGEGLGDGVGVGVGLADGRGVGSPASPSSIAPAS